MNKWTYIYNIYVVSTYLYTVTCINKWSPLRPASKCVVLFFPIWPCFVWKICVCFLKLCNANRLGSHSFICKTRLFSAYVVVHRFVRGLYTTVLACHLHLTFVESLRHQLGEAPARCLVRVHTWMAWRLVLKQSHWNATDQSAMWAFLTFLFLWCYLGAGPHLPFHAVIISSYKPGIPSMAHAT